MKKYNLISSLMWMTVGILFCIGSIGLGLGGLREPGPGFFPFVMSFCLITFSLIHLISSLRKGGESKLSSPGGVWPGKEGLKRVLPIIFMLFIYVIALKYLGFVLTTLLFMILLLRFVEPRRWLAVFLIASLTTALSYGVFQLWLRADLPAGFMGF